MSEPINDGGLAFPRPASDSNYSQEGMSLRDWFAGQALAAMTAAPDYSKGPCNQAMVDRAFIIADAMLAARLTERK